MPLKNAYTVIYERAGTELARYFLTAFNPDDGAIGVEFPDKSVFGDKGNVKFHYDATFMQDAADGKL